MTYSNSNPHNQSPHKVDLIFGINAIEAFHENELSEGILREIGALQTFEFDTEIEREAFIEGVKEARGYEYVEIINVDDDDFMPDPGNLL